MNHILTFSQKEIAFLHDIETLSAEQWGKKYHETFNEPLPAGDMYCETKLSNNKYEINILNYIPYKNEYTEEYGYNALEIIDKTNDEVIENIPITTRDITASKTIDIYKHDYNATPWFTIQLKQKQ